MDQVLGWYLALAEISGVFVGFGALISITRTSDVSAERIALIRAAVTIGLVVIVAALLPVALSRFDLDESALWRISSLVFLGLSWAVIILALRSSSGRAIMEEQARRRPLSTAFYWLALELPVQLPLLLAVLGVAPDLADALYTTALVFNLLQAAFVLAQFVYAPAASSDTDA